MRSTSRVTASARRAPALALVGLLALGTWALPPTAARAEAPPHPAPAGTAEREVIHPELTERIGQSKLTNRDTPLAVGAVAPAFPGRPRLRRGTRALILFYRGHW